MVLMFLFGIFNKVVWRKISLYEINFNSKIQKSKLKRNLWDETVNTVYIVYIVYTVFSIQTALHCLKSSMYAYINY